ncbi:putative sur7 protein [Diaporthe ampelina]|uniref:Putative sur7 protein n=1 Tax=Diaporthe ampelina TaxID=1214573 RepID=A0A0G2FN84_9PEZI|nr:putative sur7 protein [Diaporthe ampelina]
MQPSSDVYNFYVTKICQGRFLDEDDPDSDFTTTKCVSYADKKDGLGQIVNLTSSIPSSIRTGATTSISFPPVAAVKQAIANIMPFVASSAKLILALVVIRIVAGSLALAGSALLLIDIRRFIVFMLTFATLANISLLLAAGITTGVIVLQAESISGLADALSVEVQYGGNFLVLEWVTAAFAVVGSAYWLVVWFVEFRTFTFSRRRRGARQIGNWKWTWSELKQDLRGDYEKS